MDFLATLSSLNQLEGSKGGFKETRLKTMTVIQRRDDKNNRNGDFLSHFLDKKILFHLLCSGVLLKFL